MCTHMYTHICQSTFPLSTNSTSVLWSGPPWRSQVEFSPGMGWEWALKSGRNLIYIYHLLYVHKVNTYIILIWSPCEVCIIALSEKRKWTQCGKSLSHLSVLARTDTFLFSIFTAIPSCTYIQVSFSIRGNFWKIQKKTLFSPHDHSRASSLKVSMAGPLIGARSTWRREIFSPSLSGLNPHTIHLTGPGSV